MTHPEHDMNVVEWRLEERLCKTVTVNTVQFGLCLKKEQSMLHLNEKSYKRSTMP